MLPTTYRGRATVDGDGFDAELRLDDQHVLLAHANGQHSEVVRWPLSSLSVKTDRDGDYQLQVDGESFTFAPFVDDGLGDEIALRVRFAALPPARGEVVPTTASAPTVADRVRTPKKTSSRRRSPSQGVAQSPKKRVRVNSSPEIGPKAALIVLGVLAILVVAVAFISSDRTADPAVVAAGDSNAVTPDTLPFTDQTSPDSTAAPVTTAASPITLAPQATTPSTAPATTVPPTTTPSTAPTTTTAPPPPIVAGLPAFEQTPEEMIRSWTAEAAGLGQLVPSELIVDGSQYRFAVGSFVDVSGPVDADGNVAALEFRGDPSGTDNDDRAMLAALGLSVAVVEPSLPPAGRRDLLAALGLDLDRPSGAGLDGSLTYREIDYSLVWDGDSSQIVFRARPHAEEDG